MIERLEQDLLERMWRKKLLGGNHMRVENLLASVPGHVKGDLKGALKSLLRQGYVVWYNRSKGALQLNGERLKEIKELLPHG
ncbi:hypothetical protein J4419_02195 [Candidatus Woesearchaeota archaeon]|nr:hypothetical protein [Candidatus Woesearchaeota archaeon]